MGHGPLTGCRVIELIELAGLGPGPFAGMTLAELGADVVRIDRPSAGGLFPGPLEADLLNRGKRSVVLDLKHPEGLAALLDLIDRADVLIEGYRPGVTERLGIGPDVCLARNPRLVYGRMTGWGQTGPLAKTAGHDSGYVAITGALPDDPARQHERSWWPGLRERIALAFRGRTQAEWTRVFEGSDACVAPVASLTEAVSHPHLAARGTFVERDGRSQPAPAPRFCATPTSPGGTPLKPGAHTREVLEEWGAADPGALIEAGVALQS